jgi:hypothetical protein
MENTIDVTSPADISASHHPAMSWRSVVAGFLISLFTFAVLMSLGMAIGGVSLQDGANLKNSGIMSGIWMIVSVLLSLGVGSYMATRVSKFASPSVGIVQASVLAALFTGFVLWQVLGLAGWLTSAAGSVISKTASFSTSAASGNGNTIMNQANDVIEDNLAGQGVTFTPDVKTVVSGVSNRLLRGDTDSAKAYLANHSNLTQADINAKVDQVNAQVKKAGDDARVAAAKALQVSGWSLFAVLALSWIGAVIGSLMAATANARMPITNVEFRRKHTVRPAYT